MLDMEVYHNEQKQLQFIKEYQWSYLYEKVLFDVVRNTVAMFIIELLQHSLKQPEANPELFYLIEDTLKQLDKGTETLTGNLHCILHYISAVNWVFNCMENTVSKHLCSTCRKGCSLQRNQRILIIWK